jgi:sec-independent protein translocase protein TatC
MIFHRELWEVVRQPIIRALVANGQKPELSQFSPVDAIMVVWVYMPLLTSVFLASPWILYQVWAFIAPGLYKRERKWAGPFVVVSASLFILGGIFAYYVAFPLGLDFLLGAGKSYGFQAVLAGDKYFDLFVNVMLGVGLLFEMPVLVFLLTLIGLVTPGFLLRNSRYAILIIVILAAFLTPTPDIFNLTIFAAPMILLYFVGIFGGWILTLHRQGRKGVLRWLFLSAVAAVLLGVGGLLAAVFKFGYHLSSSWPFLVR